MSDSDIFGPDHALKPLDIGQALLSIRAMLGEPGMLNEANLAWAIRYLVSAKLNDTPFSDDDVAAFFLSVADALDHPEASTVLKIGYAGAGHPEKNIDRYLRESRDGDVLFDVFTDLQKHGQLEAAVSATAERNGRSRSTIFKIIRRAARLDIEQRTRKDGTVVYSNDFESRQYEIWLDRYRTSGPAQKV